VLSGVDVFLSTIDLTLGRLLFHSPATTTLFPSPYLFALDSLFCIQPRHVSQHPFIEQALLL
jgi:hypothetical protein